MSLHLTAAESRVLGCLIEKEITTPDYYPLSLNALVNACNQKSNRDPEMNLDDRAVESALQSLGQKNLAGRADNMDGRVTKYEHRLQEAFNFTRLESAVLCELFLRGPQTPGELRGRASRMHAFDDLQSVIITLQKLMDHDPPLVKILPRQPGTKEQRYAHALSDEPDASRRSLDRSGARSSSIPQAATPSPTADSSTAGRISELELQVSVLQKEVSALKQQLSDFEKQFS